MLYKGFVFTVIYDRFRPFLQTGKLEGEMCIKFARLATVLIEIPHKQAISTYHLKLRVTVA